MEPLSVSIARERSRLFVGREAELSALDQWLATPRAPTRLFHVTGMGGIGKSTLLRRMLARAREQGVAGLWIDGRDCTPTPGGFLAYLGALLGHPGRLTPDRLQVGVPRDGRGKRSIWCIDNYEALEPLHGWLWETLFPQLPSSGHLVVIASRPSFTETWRMDPGWRPRVLAMALGPWTSAESAEYLRRVGIPARYIGALSRATGGQPLAVAVVADAFPRRPQALKEVAREAARAVSAGLLREAAGRRLEPLLDALAVVPEGDRGLLRSMLNEPPPEEHLQALARLSFVQALPTGFRLHDVARNHLRTDLQGQDPERFHELRRRAVRSLIRRLNSVMRQDRRPIAAALLTICADALPSADQYATLSTPLAGTVRAATRDDLPRLHGLADAWGRQPFVLSEQPLKHRLLDRAVERFPQAVRVVQGERGEPLAFLTTILLHRSSVMWLEEVDPGAIARNVPDEHPRLAVLPPDEADTYLALLVGVDPQAEEASPEELVGLLMRDGLAHLGEGARALVRAFDPDLQGLLGRLGFHEHPAAAPAASNTVAGRVYKLDLRSGRFGPWVLSFLERTDPYPRIGEGASALSPADLRDLLKGWYDPAVWEQSPVPPALSTDGAALRRKLHQILVDGKKLPPPLSEDDQVLLRQTYVTGQPPDLIASNLHISRATYYRHLSRALEQLAAALADDPS